MQVERSFYTTFSHEFSIERHEDVACNLCGAPDYRTIATELGRYEIRQCARCSLVYVSPQPAESELPRFYEGMYADTSEASMARRSVGAVERHLRRIIRRRKPRGGRFLEVGCGSGRFLRSVSDLPFEFRAIELSEAAANYARSINPRARIDQAGIFNAEIPPHSQDCITIIAVLEHVKDPKAALARLTSWLAPGGLLVVLVPYVSAYIRLKRWLPWLPVHFEAPRHLYDFSPKTLTRYLRELGFDEIRVEIARPYSANSPLGVALIWTVKLLGLALYHLSARRYVYPYAGAIVVHGLAPRA